jgi:hypothetical protein
MRAAAAAAGGIFDSLTSLTLNMLCPESYKSTRFESHFPAHQGQTFEPVAKSNKHNPQTPD